MARATVSARLGGITFFGDTGKFAVRWIALESSVPLPFMLENGKAVVVVYFRCLFNSQKILAS